MNINTPCLRPDTTDTKRQPIMVKRYYKLIRVKIFGIVLGVLLLLLLVAYFSTLQLKKLNHELQDLAEYTIPITNLIAKVNIHVLTQELHMNRICRLHINQKGTPQQINRKLENELGEFKQRGQLVHQELQQAIVLSRETAKLSPRQQEQQAFKHFLPLLERIKSEYQQSYTYSLTTLQHLTTRKNEDVYKSQALLLQKRQAFDQEISAMLDGLEYFTTQAAQTAERHERAMLNVYLLITSIAIATALLFASLTATRLTRAIRKLTTSVKEVSKKNYDTHIDQVANDEVGKLSDSFNYMLSELKMKVEIEAQFAKHIDPRMVDKIINDPEESRTGGKKEQMTIFFSNIEDFDSLLPNQSIDESIKQKNHYYDIMTAAIIKHQGVVDKFIGSTVMAFWGAPFVETTEHCQLACLAALDQIKNINQLTQQTNANPSSLPLHIGMATGSVVVGNIGSETSKSFTVMGDTVNIASRLKGVAKQYGLHVVIPEQTKLHIQDSIETREIDLIRVIGKDEPIRIYELIGVRIDIKPQQIAWRDSFEQGLSAYRKQEWNIAEKHFTTCLTINPQDQPCQLFLQRIENLRQKPPVHDWDGVWQMVKK